MTQIQVIVQVNTRDQRGGAERVMWNLFRAYQARGRASWLAVGKKYSNDPQVWKIINAPHATSCWTRTWLRLSEALTPLRGRGKGWKGVAALQARLHLVAQPVADSAVKAMKILPIRDKTSARTVASPTRSD